MNKPLIIALIYSVLVHIAVFATVLIAETAHAPHTATKNNNITAISVAGKQSETIYHSPATGIHHSGESQNPYPTPQHGLRVKPAVTIGDNSILNYPNKQSDEIIPAPEEKTIVGGNIITPPVELHFPKPKYPVTAKKRNLQGSVRLSISIDETGSVTTMEVIESSRYKILDDAALSVKDKLRYTPATKDGNPIAFTLTKTVTFTLEQR